MPSTRLTLALVCAAGSLALLAAASLAAPHLAHACGGCFSGETITSVNSHRMVVSLSPDRSILWDQIRYSGDPEDFVWVLPVPSADAQVAVADDLFFSELEAFTAPVVNPPPLPPLDCPPPPSCGWFCSEDDPGGLYASSDAGASPGGVDVYREEVVGPYETVVIGSEDPAALVAWLNDHGYKVPAETTPVIQHYTDAKSLFVVLRLAPQQGVGAMQPIRVEYPGYMGTFPLKMVTVGAYGSLQMTLWIVAEQRYKSTNYATGEIDPATLVWDFLAAASNYSDQFRQKTLELGGRAWITQFAQPLDTLFLSSPDGEVARNGIQYPFLTRLQADMLIDHLSADLQLGPSSDPPVSNFIQAGSYVNDTRTCPDYNGDGEPDTWDDYYKPDGFFGCGGCTAPRRAASGGTLIVAAAALLLARRRRRYRCR